MAQTQRPDRKPVLEKFNPLERELLVYRAEGQNMIMTFYPKLGSTFPVLEVTQRVKDGIKPPIDLPTREAYTGWIELYGVIYHVIVVIYGNDYLPELTRGEGTTGSTQAAYVFDSNGKLLSSIGDIGVFNPGQLAENLRLKLDFDKNGKAIEASAIKTVLNAPNIEEMVHTWSATIKAPGLPVYTIEGDVVELRRGGIKPEKYSYWKSAVLWNQTVNGKQFKHIIAEDVNGVTHTVTHGPDGAVLNVSKARAVFGVILRAADYQAQINL